MADRSHNRDIELISAYVDGELSPREQQALEMRLAQEAALRRELEAVRADVQLLRGLPRVKAPRNFTLDPAVYGRAVRRGGWWGMRLSAALGAAAALVLALGVLFLATPGDTQKGVLNIAAERSPTSPPASFEAFDDTTGEQRAEQDQDEASGPDQGQAAKLTSVARGERLDATLPAPTPEDLSHGEPAGEPFFAVQPPEDDALPAFGGGGDVSSGAEMPATGDSAPQVDGVGYPAGAGGGGDAVPAEEGMVGEFIPPGGEAVIEPSPGLATDALDAEAEASSEAHQPLAMAEAPPAPAMPAASTATPPPLAMSPSMTTTAPTTATALTTATATVTPAVEVAEAGRDLQAIEEPEAQAVAPTSPPASGRPNGWLAESGEPGDDHDTLGVALLIIGAVMLVVAVWGGLLSVWRRR